MIGHPETFRDGSWHNYYDNDEFIVKDLQIAEELFCEEESQSEEERDGVSDSGSSASP